MAVNDVPIWERWLELHASEFEGFDYDVRVGRGRNAPASFSPEFRKDITDLTQMRIDAVAVQSGLIDIIEVKQNAGASAIGQVLTYKELYEDSPEALLIRRLVIVTDNPHPDLVRAAEKLGVVVETV